LSQALTSAGICSSVQSTRDAGFPDVEVELEAHATLEAIRNVMRDVEDGHVMVQTLQACPLAKNTLERDYSA
jgi:hypothetical protein